MLIGAIFIALVGVAVFLERRRLAHAQALILGGRVLPGCVVFEAAVLIAIAIVIALQTR